MFKKTILISNSSPAIPKQDFWRPQFERYFDVVQMTPNDVINDYNPKETIFWGSSPESTLNWIEPVLDANFPVVLDYLWDHFGYSHTADKVLLLRSNNFIYANEALNYKLWGYHKLDYTKKADKFFLCLMHQIRNHRDQLYQALEKFQDISLLSYLERGILVPGDVLTKNDKNELHVGSPAWQRYVNVDWYTSTNFSIVAETGIHDPRFYSEKILKPFAHKHPFLVYGPYQIIDRLKLLGFESFENIIDETYNQCQDHDKRFMQIISEVEKLHKEFVKHPNMFEDSLTKEKLEHNFNLFYNESLYQSIIDKEIFEPLLEFAYG